ncbi:MAG TPA: isochorismatase family protein [Caulobacterales bacterium]|nr:isochorismatase family protein [Caulobacterales bacterium]
MTISVLDPQTALVLIDLQKGIVSRQTVHPIPGVMANAVALAKAFRARGLPVVLVNVAGLAPGRTEAPRMSGAFPPDWMELAPDLDEQPTDLKVTKRTWGAFHNTELEKLLRERGVSQIVLGGVSTSAGVESTARQAHERGFNVALAVDAMTDMSPEAHENSVTRIFPRLGETGTAQEIIAKLGETRA